VADKVPEDSFLEGNVVDVRGDMRVVLRTIIDGYTTSSIASIARFRDDGTDITYEFLQLYPMPGGQCRVQPRSQPARGIRAWKSPKWKDRRRTGRGPLM